MFQNISFVNIFFIYTLLQLLFSHTSKKKLSYYYKIYIEVIFIKTISLCVITRNNENTIYKCLSSVKDLVDEIIIVDTGSTDETLSICTAFNAKIFKSKWEDNFSKPRNKALSLSTCDFILVLDSDEYLPPETCVRIRENLEKRSCKAYSLLIHSLNSNMAMNHGLTRLFINDKDVYFEHRVHEQIDWSFKRKYKNEFDYCFTDMVIYHTGYDKSLDPTLKIKRNNHILTTYSDEEKDEYYYYLIGRDKFFNHDFKSALEYLNKAFIDSYKVQGQLKYIFLLRLSSFISLSMYTDVLNEGLRAIKTDPEFKDVYYFLYLAYHNTNNYNLAYQNLIAFKNIHHNDVFYPRLILIPETTLDLTILKYNLTYLNGDL